MEKKGYYLNALPAGGEVTLLAVVAEKELRPKKNWLWCKRLSDEGSCHDASVCFGRSIVQRTAFR